MAVQWFIQNIKHHRPVKLIASLKVGQYVTSTTGLSLQYLRRIKLNEGIRYSYEVGELWNYSTEDELFDDPYSYEGHEISAIWTQLLPWKVMLKLGYDYYLKNYSIAALDLEGQPLPISENRDDRRNVVWVNVSKTFSQVSVLRNFQLYLDFYYLNNSSNDLYFQYNNSVFIIGTGLSL